MGEVARRSCADIREEEKEEGVKEFYQHVIQHSQCGAVRVFLAGSRSEIPGQENMLCQYGLSLDLLDVDLMFCATEIYVTTCRETVLDQFNGRALRMHSGGLHAGYAKLFYDDFKTEFKRTDLIPVNAGYVLRGPVDVVTMTDNRAHNDIIKCLISEENWVASTTDSIWLEERAVAVHSRYWPLEMNEWITRQRRPGLPSKAIIKKVVRYGYDCVKVSPKHSTDLNEWRFSLSKAELIIIHSWTTSQRCVYRTLHTLNKMIKSSMDDSKLCTYYFKTLMLWATEEKPAEFWSEHDLVNSIYKLLCELMHWLKRKFCPNYFIPTNNMIDHLTDTELFECIHSLYQLLQSQYLIVDVLSKSRSVETHVSNQKYYIKVAAWLYASLLIWEQLVYSEDIFTRLFTNSSSALIDQAMFIELSNIYHALYYYIMTENSLIQPDNYYLTKSVKHFHCNELSLSSDATLLVHCSRTVAQNLIPSCSMQYKPDTSESHLLLATLNAFTSTNSWNVLNLDNNKTDEKCLLYIQSMDNVDKAMATDVHFNENIYGNYKTTVTMYETSTVDNKTDTHAECYKDWPLMSPTVHISWFINNAYVANLYYISRRDYRATEEMCDYIIHVCKQSYYNRVFAECSFPVILSTEWTSFYDEDLQAMLGLYFLCSFLFNKPYNSRSVCLGVCPVWFALYLKCRCAADQMDSVKWNKCVNEVNEHFDKCIAVSRVHNGQWAVQASLMVVGDSNHL